MELTIVRHGQTVENAKDIIMGQNGGTLSEKGISQAKDTAEKLKDQHFDQIWSSDLKRCIDTAKYILAFHPDLKLQLTPALREVHYGKYQGQLSATIQPIFIEHPDWLTLTVPGGESHLDMFGRVVGFINHLYKESPDQSILVVTHSGPIHAIKAAVEKQSKEETFNKDALNASAWQLEISKPLEFHFKA